MDNLTNCPNCGAVVDRHADRCAYCETPYSKAQICGGYAIRLDAVQLTRLVDMGMITRNEARARLGLPQV